MTNIFVLDASSGGYFGNTTLPSVLSDVVCNPSYTDIFQCDFMTIDGNTSLCNGSRSAGVVCNSKLFTESYSIYSLLFINRPVKSSL